MADANIKGFTVAAFGDTHTGSTVGLMRPETYNLIDGTVKPSKAQRALWRVFMDYAQIIKKQRAGRRLVVVLNGDLCDGVHHNTPQIVTRRMAEQQRLFVDVWQAFVDVVEFGDDDQVYIINGTDLNGTHGSPSDADIIGRAIGAVPWKPPGNSGVDGWHPWQHLKLDVNGLRLEFAHHPPAGLGRREHTKGNSVRGWLRDYQSKLHVRKKKIPRYVIWSHVHTAYRTTMTFDTGRPDGPDSTAVILPAFQGKTDYVHQKLPFTMPTTIGGWWCNIDDDGAHFDRLEYIELGLDRKAVKID